MEFKDIIKEIMKEEGLNQTKLANKLGIGQGHVTDWIRGKCDPSYRHLQNICKKLNISAERILGLENY